MSSKTIAQFQAAYPERTPRPLPDASGVKRTAPTKPPPACLSEDLRAKAVKMRDMAGWLLAEANDLELTAIRMERVIK